MKYQRTSNHFCELSSSKFYVAALTNRDNNQIKRQRKCISRIPSIRHVIFIIFYAECIEPTACSFATTVFFKLSLLRENPTAITQIHHIFKYRQIKPIVPKSVSFTFLYTSDKMICHLQWKSKRNSKLTKDWNKTLIFSRC